MSRQGDAESRVGDELSTRDGILGDIAVEVDPGEDVRVAGTPDLAEPWFDAAFDDPSILEGILGGAYLIFLLADEPELAGRHRQAGFCMREAGRPVRFVTVWWRPS